MLLAKIFCLPELGNLLFLLCPALKWTSNRNRKTRFVDGAVWMMQWRMLPQQKRLETIGDNVLEQVRDTESHWL